MPETLEIVELRSKYVHAFRESTGKLETLFPGLTGFTSIHVGEPKPDNTPTEGMAKFLEMVMLDGEQTKEIAGLYRKGVLTINQLATMLNRDVIDVFRGLASSPDFGIYSAPHDRKTAMAVSEALTRSTRLIADVTAVLTLHWLGLAEAVTDAFGRIAVTQSTVDLLHQNLEGYRFAREGFGLIGVTDGRLTFTQVSAEEVSRISEEVGAVLRWLAESAEILPCNPRLALRRGQAHELAQALGRSFADTALVAAERGYVLFSDDLRFRWYASRLFGIGGVWSQAVLQRCAMMKHLNTEDFSKAVVELVRRSYRYTWVSCDELVESARQCEWGIEEPFVSTVKVFKDYTVPSACKVTAEFLKTLYAEPVPGRRSLIIQAVLDYLTRNHEPMIILT
ncbi:MAG TPA: hypothetical protein GX716_00990, partial [Firmicutes bacterium]|nr:hypothetical protein [Candidatus Fermentithermobacillaceae bacterium]